MLDIKFVRENPDAIDTAMANRQTSWDREKFFELDDERRAVITEVEELQATRNAESKKIGALMKDEAEAAKEAVRAVNEKIDGLAERRTALEQEQYDFMAHLPNIPCEATPFGKDEDENIERRRWGTPREFDFDFKPHWDLGTDLDILDFERGNKLSGSRFTVLGGAGARLERALINFFLDTHTSRGFKEWWPPIVVKRQTMFGTGQLPKFEDDAYHVSGDNFLIPTAEVPVTNLFRDEIIEENELPIKCCAYSACFRREAGSYGKDVRGLNRLHQFDKVEIVRIDKPEHSYESLNEMLAHVEGLCQKLELPYHILRLCGGDMSFTSAICYDFEVWSAAQKRWLEVSSVSNFESYQANRLHCRYRNSETKKIELCHTLNGSALALPRIVAAILENNQTPEGIRVPKVLVPYCGFDMIDDKNF